MLVREIAIGETFPWRTPSGRIINVKVLDVVRGRAVLGFDAPDDLAIQQDPKLKQEPALSTN